MAEYRGFLGCENILRDTIMKETCHYTFIQTHKMYSTKSEPLGKLWALSDYNVSVVTSIAL